MAPKRSTGSEIRAERPVMLDRFICGHVATVRAWEIGLGTLVYRLNVFTCGDPNCKWGGTK